jgi:hypothetical protein
MNAVKLIECLCNRRDVGRQQVARYQVQSYLERKIESGIGMHDKKGFLIGAIGVTFNNLHTEDDLGHCDSV